MKEVLNKLVPGTIGKDIEKACQSIYPLHDVFVRKVKMLKKPKFELGKLMELHGEGGSDTMTKASLIKKQHLIGAGLQIQRFSPLPSRWEHGSIQAGMVQE